MTQGTKRNWPKIVVLSMAVFILAAGLYGFGLKFWDFIRTVRKDREGRFALIPILNYLLASAGFACLFVWAAKNGMFKDIEKPKYDLLERERALDLQDGIDWEQQP